MSSSQENLAKIEAKIFKKYRRYSVIFKNEVIEAVRDTGNNVNKSKIAKKIRHSSKQSFYAFEARKGPAARKIRF